MVKKIIFILLGATFVALGFYAVVTQTFERGSIAVRGGGAIVIGLVWMIFGAYILYAVFSERKK